MKMNCIRCGAEIETIHETIEDNSKPEQKMWGDGVVAVNKFN
jgi:hypothetical protein